MCLVTPNGEKTDETPIIQTPYISPILGCKYVNYKPLSKYSNKTLEHKVPCVY